MGPHPAVAAIRLAVRRVLHDVLTDQTPPSADRPGSADKPASADTASIDMSASADTPASIGTPHELPPSPRPRSSREVPPSPPLVLVACSGGADSMALASALAFEAPKLGIRAGGVTVDHGLQPGSDLRAEEVVARLTELGLTPVESTAVSVGRQGGPEAAARDARYAALDAAAERHGAAAVLLGHTRDDQAETVLLGLARGSGIRSLSGMAAVSGGPGAAPRNE